MCSHVRRPHLEVHLDTLLRGSTSDLDVELEEAVLELRDRQTVAIQDDLLHFVGQATRLLNHRVVRDVLHHLQNDGVVGDAEVGEHAVALAIDVPHVAVQHTTSVHDVEPVVG